MITLNTLKIKNFRNIKEVVIDFSVDEAKPLTIIRAENGVGKTTLLLALRWVLFGDLANPASTPKKKKPLIKAPASWDISKHGSEIPVEVELWLTSHGGNGDTEYHVLRKQTVRVSEADRIGQDQEEVIEVYKKTPTGMEALKFPEEFITTQVLTHGLMEFFLVDGEEFYYFGDDRSPFANHGYLEAAVKLLAQRGEADVEEIRARLSKRIDEIFHDLIAIRSDADSDGSQNSIVSVEISPTFGIEVTSAEGRLATFDRLTASTRSTLYASLLLTLSTELGGQLPLVIDAGYSFLSSALRTNLISSLLNASTQPVLLMNSFEIEGVHDLLLANTGRYFELYFDEVHQTLSREIEENN